MNSAISSFSVFLSAFIKGFISLTKGFIVVNKSLNALLMSGSVRLYVRPGGALGKMIIEA